MATLAEKFSRPIFVGAATRSPIGKFGGSLKRFTAPRLAALTLHEALKRAPEAPAADFVLMGHARQAGAGPNPARQATLFSGLNESIPAITVNQACASGLAALVYGSEKILSGRAQSIWAGGVESMSNTPYMLMKARWGQRLGHDEVVDGMYQDGFHCPMADMVMGETVERFIATEQKISRAEQDEYALLSQQRAGLATGRGHFKIETFEIAAEGKLPGLAVDEHARADTSLDSLSRLAPVFDLKNGTITAGNSSGITDGAAFLHLSAQKLPHSVAELVDFECTALDPRKMGLGPISSIENLLKRQKLQVNDIELFEINEAFAAQLFACQRALKIPIEKLNVNGGAIALGHPIGATGARISVTLLNNLSKRPGALGIASLCVSGGMGLSVLYKML